MRLPFYGFEHVDLCTAHGDHVGGQYYVWLKSRRPDADALRDRANQLPHDYVCPQAFRTPIPEELYPTAYIAEKSCEWLDHYAAGDHAKPFFLMTSFPDPHHPFTPPGRYWSMYAPQDMALPRSFASGNRPPARAAAGSRVAAPTAAELARKPRRSSDDDVADMFILLVGHVSWEQRRKPIDFQGHRRWLRRLPPQPFTPIAREMLVMPCEALPALPAVASRGARHWNLPGWRSLCADPPLTNVGPAASAYWLIRAATSSDRVATVKSGFASADRHQKDRGGGQVD
jgi:hypothetical protein